MYQMSKKPSIESLLLSELNSVYCDTCSSYGLDDEHDDYGCDDCIRKAMMWSLSESSAKRLADKIRELDDNS
jgi:hypothetical protein